jgi:DNA-binding NarL/FixJ family response regulator
VIGSSPSSAVALELEPWRPVEDAGHRDGIRNGGSLSESTDTASIRVLLVDDQPAATMRLAASLSRNASDVDAAVRSGAEAVSSLAHEAPDVVLVVQRSRAAAAATCRAILQRRPELPVAVLAPNLDDASIRECLTAGARGYAISKANRDLLPVIRAISKGDRWLDPEVVDRIVGWALEDRRPRGAPPLSHREKAVLALLAAGKPNREIATRLEVSTGTVKATIASLLRKLGAKNRTEAVSTALRFKIL